MIYLEDFYEDGKYYIYNNEKRFIEPVADKINLSNTNGYFALEVCGLRKNNNVGIAYFEADGKEWLYADGYIISFDNQKLQIVKKVIIPFFLEKITFNMEGNIFECIHWIGNKEDTYSTDIFHIVFSKFKNLRRGKT